MRTIVTVCVWLGLAVTSALAQTSQDVQDSITTTHPGFDQSNPARDLTKKYHPESETKPKQEVVPALVTPSQGALAKNRAVASEKLKKLDRERTAYVKATAGTQARFAAQQAAETGEKSEFHQRTAEKSAAQNWDAKHKKEIEQLKQLQSTGLVVPPLMQK